ncbi:MAG: glutamate--tRNA ligase family protein [Armatimonadota bacterium]
MVVTRFCPTPDGHLHHGSVYTAILNQEFALRHAGKFVVEVDDLAIPWVRQDLVESFREDLGWLGICSQDEVLMRSRNKSVFLEMLDALAAEGKIGISHVYKGCCLSEFAVMQNGRPVTVSSIRASSNAPGVAGLLSFASSPQHVLSEHQVALVSEDVGMLRETYWCSHPKDREPWLELELPAGVRIGSIKLTWRLPRPLEVEILAMCDGHKWRRVSLISHSPVRSPSWWGSFVAPGTDREDMVAMPPDLACPRAIRLNIRSLQPMEEYTLCESGETVCHDVCLGGVSVEKELEFRYFAWPASDILLGSTHVIRGAELVHTLPQYVRLMQLLGHPVPVFCHVPPLVDETGEKLAKSLHNAPRIVEQLRSEGMNPSEARRWIIENAYTNVKEPTPLHSFEAQMKLLEATVPAQHEPII